MNRRFTGDALVVVGIFGAVVGAVLVARGVGLIFWVIVTLVAVGLLAAVLLWLIEVFFARDLGSLVARYRDRRVWAGDLDRDDGV